MRSFSKLVVFTAIFLFCATATPVLSQGVVTLDWGGGYSLTTSTTTHTAPIAHWYTRTRHQYLITPQDFANIGLIPTGPVTLTSLAFYVDGWNNCIKDVDEFNISMKNTSLTAVPTNFDNSGGYTACYVAHPFVRSQWTVPGWHTFQFDTPFIWDGVSNIIIEACHQQTWTTSYDYSYTYAYRYSTVGTGRQQYYYSDGLYNQMCTYNYSYAVSYLPWMQFGCGGSSSISNFDTPSLYNVPSILPIQYEIGNPLKDFTGNIVFTLKTPQGQVVATETLSGIVCPAGVIVSGTYNFNAMNVTPGWYIIELDFTVLNSCGFEDHVVVNDAILLLAPGSQVCEVWPGDTDNDGLVNYADRAALNKYIHDANLSPLWLNGPQRLRIDAETNPLTYIQWEMQPSAPWNTPDGCYKDTDGNGVINNFDYIAIKLNWMRAQDDAAVKQSAGLTGLSFEMEQNFPNPFNPTTSIRYSAPERSQVRLVVTDMLGREVATLVNTAVDAGVHTAQFDASQLPSGHYIATVTMAGLESGLTFSKTVKMSLNK